MQRDLEGYYKNRKVFITGHTGFKGSWLSTLLLLLGADVVGYSLKPPTKPSAFSILQLENRMRSYYGDIRDYSNLFKVMNQEQPEIVIHLAAQPLVRTSYEEPVLTYETNVMGTVNLLEAVRKTESVKSVVNITTDKVYENKEWDWGYRENDILNGYDPYSNSKSCSELVTSGYINSFFNKLNLPVSTCRAGNVIGGGDFARDRIIPDCIRASMTEQKIVLRNPESIRPFQHVLEPATAYLKIAKEQVSQIDKAGSYNIGPLDLGCVTTGELVSIFCKYWGEKSDWIIMPDVGLHEAGFLKLDCSKVKSVFGISPSWNVETAVRKTVEWHKKLEKNYDMWEFTQSQIREYLNCKRG